VIVQVGEVAGRIDQVIVEVGEVAGRTDQVISKVAVFSLAAVITVIRTALSP